MAGPMMGPGGRHRPGPGGAKPQNAGATLKRLLPYLKKDIPLILMVSVFVLFSTICQLFAAKLLTPVFDCVAAGDPAGAGLNLIYMAIIYVIGAGSTFVQSRVMIRISQHIALKMRIDLFDHAMTLPVRFFDRTPHGDIMSRFTNDLDTVSQSLNTASVQLISSVASFIGTFVMMISINVWLTFITMIVFPLMIVISRSIIKRSQRYFKEQQAALGDLNGNIEETIEGQKIVKIFCRESRAEEEFRTYNYDFRDKATKAQMVSGILMPLMQRLNTLNYVLVAIVGGAMALNGILSLGSIATFLSLARQFGQPISQITQQIGQLQSALAGAERVFAVMDMEPEPADKPDAAALVYREGKPYWDYQGTLRPICGNVVMTDVSFRYNPDKPILKHISLYAKAGQKIAFVGSTGAGKTTIANLLTRFYDIDEGSITIDGIGISDIRLADLRRAQAIVLQDTHLFSGSVMENIRYGRMDATDEDCIAAAKLASAHSFIMRLPNGYDTVLEQDGGNLSQGQRQLLNIARAAVADPAFLILDEATSSVDTRTELHIEHGMDRLMQDRTTFIIAHRLSTVRNANAIMVIEHGEILERGDHDDLLAQKGRYYMLYAGQFKLN